MKYNVRKKHNKFIVAFETGLEYLEEQNFPPKSSKEFLFQTSVLNSIWQAWTLFWRTYWLAEILGGIDIHNKIIIPLHPHLTEEEAVYFLFTKNFGGRKRRSEEKGWGDLAVLSFIARQMYEVDGNVVPVISVSQKALTISTAISLLGNSVNHMQLVRNCSIHLHEYNALRVKTISGSYVLPNFRYPTDILFAPTLTDGKKAIVNWHEEISALLSFVD